MVLPKKGGVLPKRYGNFLLSALTSAYCLIAKQWEYRCDSYRTNAVGIERC